MKHNGGEQAGVRRPEEILADIDRTRNEMDHTLDSIERRLTPGQLMDQSIDYLRHSGANEFVQNLGGQVKYNPLPVTLVGIGLAWLMAAGKKQPDYGTTAGQATSEKFGEMRDRATAATQSARERIGAIGTSAREQVDRAKSGAQYMLREQPLALGAVGLAIGAVLAAMAPRTRQEDELMGETSDRVKEQARDAGKETLEQAKEAGKEKLEQATQAAKAAASSSEKTGDSQQVGADLTPRGPGGARRTS